MLADPTGEDQGVQPRQRGGRRRDGGRRSAGKHIDGELGPFVSRPGSLFNLAHAGSPAIDSRKPGVVVERLLELAPARPPRSQHI